MGAKRAASLSPWQSCGLGLAAADQRAGSETPVGGEPGAEGVWDGAGPGRDGKTVGSWAASLLCRQTAESFPPGHARVLQPPRRVCPRADVWPCPLALTGQKLRVPHHLLTPHRPSSPVHPWVYRSPLHPVPCREKLQRHGPCGAGMGGQRCCGWAGSLGIPWTQEPGTFKLGASGKYLEVKPEKVERGALTAGRGCLLSPFCVRARPPASPQRGCWPCRCLWSPLARCA